MSEEKKKKPSFQEAVSLLCDRFGYVDFAVVARAVDGAKESFWFAGDGDNKVGDRERAGMLHFEMAELQESIIQFCRPPRVV